MSTVSPTKQIIRLVGKAIGDFELVEENDRILVALSGGKDSWSLLYALLALQKKAPIDYQLGAVTIGPDLHADHLLELKQRLRADNIPHHFIVSDINSIISTSLTKGTSPCSLCSRIRRGVLYSFASREGWNKIALGHHLDDFVETLLLNLFFNGSIKGMSPKLQADDGKNTVIRPLVYVREENTHAMADEMRLPVTNCGCVFETKVESKRHWVKKLLTDIEKDAPNIKSSILSSMGRVCDRHLLDMRRHTGSYNKTVKMNKVV
jgi:tRNA 2-thiocytidine biosynthesis protein TtcA